MSLSESARNAIWSQKHAEAEEAAACHRARLQTLFAVASTTSLPPVLSNLRDPISTAVLEFLAQNDVLKDHRFQVSSLPIPPFYAPLQQAAASVSIHFHELGQSSVEPSTSSIDRQSPEGAHIDTSSEHTVVTADPQKASPLSPAQTEAPSENPSSFRTHVSDSVVDLSPASTQVSAAKDSQSPEVQSCAPDSSVSTSAPSVNKEHVHEPCVLPQEVVHDVELIPIQVCSSPSKQAQLSPATSPEARISARPSSRHLNRVVTPDGPDDETSLGEVKLTLGDNTHSIPETRRAPMAESVVPLTAISLEQDITSEQVPINGLVPSESLKTAVDIDSTPTSTKSLPLEPTIPIHISIPTPTNAPTSPEPPSRPLSPPVDSSKQFKLPRLRPSSSRVIIMDDSRLRTRELLQKHQTQFDSLDHAPEAMQHDYLKPLFAFQARQLPRTEALRSLVARSSKTLTTSNWITVEREGVDYRILKRIYQLQNANKWPLRQLGPQTEPPRSLDHWDRILIGVKSMRTDFREERKWKLSLARNLARSCSRWVYASAEERRYLQVNAKIPPKQDGLSPATIQDRSFSGSLQDVTMTDALADDFGLKLDLGTSTSHLFELGYDDIIFEIPQTPFSSSQLEQIPSYQVTLDKHLEQKPKREELMHTSHNVHTKIIAFNSFHGIKSRYMYEDEPDGETNNHPLPPEQGDVALFLSEHQSVRDRLHLNHAFRPPSEFIMPSASFFECRSSSHWLWDDDQKLMDLVKEYWYNWSFISTEMSFPSLFNSSAERRTPWECFERWVQLQGLPTEMVKTHYFRTYIARLDTGTKTAIAKQDLAERIRNQHFQQNQSVDSNPQAQIPPARARRTTLPLRVDRHRAERYLSILDSMRKMAKKREFLQAKHQESLKAAQLRKANEVPQPRTNVHAPQELSRIKHEREMKLLERHELYKQQIMAQQQNVAWARHSQQQAQLQAQQAAAAAARAQSAQAQAQAQLAQAQAQARVQASVNQGVLGGASGPNSQMNFATAQSQQQQQQHQQLQLQQLQQQQQQRMASTNGVAGGISMQALGSRQSNSNAQLLVRQLSRSSAMQPSPSNTGAILMPGPSMSPNQLSTGGANIARAPIPNPSAESVRLFQQQQQQQQQRVFQLQQQAQAQAHQQQQRLGASVNLSQQSQIQQNPAILTPAAGKMSSPGTISNVQATATMASHAPQGGQPVHIAPNPADMHLLNSFVSQLMAQSPTLTLDQARHLAKDRFQRLQQQRASALAAATGSPGPAGSVAAPITPGSATSGGGSAQRPASVAVTNGVLSVNPPGSAPQLPISAAVSGQMANGQVIPHAATTVEQQQQLVLMQQRMLRQQAQQVQQQHQHQQAVQQQALAARMTASPSVDAASSVGNRPSTSHSQAQVAQAQVQAQALAQAQVLQAQQQQQAQNAKLVIQKPPIPGNQQHQLRQSHISPQMTGLQMSPAPPASSPLQLPKQPMTPQQRLQQQQQQQIQQLMATPRIGVNGGPVDLVALQQQQHQLESLQRQLSSQSGASHGGTISGSGGEGQPGPSI